MSRPVAVFVSYRLGGADGVSVETAKWEWALGQLGFATRRVAGELTGLRPDDVWLPFLAIEPPPGAHPEPEALAAAIAGTDLVVVENLVSLPLNQIAPRVAADVVCARRGRVLLHHHDLPWERPGLAQLDGFPPRPRDALHVTINDRARRALEQRGIPAVTIRNSFDLDQAPGDRDATRAAFGFEPDELVMLQPTRAIPRKNVAAGIAYAEALASQLGDQRVRYWLTGPAEDGFGPELDRLVAATPLRVTLGRADRPTGAYAACDVVVFPSTEEGFGNPVVEAVAARRPLVVGHYPVLDELLALGIDTFPLADPSALADWLAAPDPARLERNLAHVRAQLSLDDLPSRIEAAFRRVGWDRW